jgi:hypothetical protein
MTSNQNDAYADRVVHEALLAATGGLDADRVAEAVTKVVEAIDKQAAALKAATYRPEDYERIARAMAHAMKSADGLYRLVEFAAGRPDSRPDKASDWLRGLTDEQLRTVQGWIEANALATETERSGGGAATDPLPSPRGRRSAT